MPEHPLGVDEDNRRDERDANDGHPSAVWREPKTPEDPAPDDASGDTDKQVANEAIPATLHGDASNPDLCPEIHGSVRADQDHGDGAGQRSDALRATGGRGRRAVPLARPIERRVPPSTSRAAAPASSLGWFHLGPGTTPVVRTDVLMVAPSSMRRWQRRNRASACDRRRMTR